jgi:hypothetical protein
VAFEKADAQVIGGLATRDVAFAPLLGTLLK